MHTNNPAEQYKIEYTDLFGVVYFSPCTNYTREFARAIVRDLRTRGMFDTGRRAALKDVRVVKS